MSAAAWFFVSAVLFALGGYMALFTVTTYRGRNALVCLGFMSGAFLNLMFILMIILRSTA